MSLRPTGIFSRVHAGPIGRVARRRWVRVSAVLVATVSLLAFVIARLIDEPLRRDIEARMNAQLEGYTVRIGELDFHPLGFSLDLERLIVVQDAHPKPPIFDIARLTASVQWRALIHRRLVADLRFEKPKLHFDQTQAAKEAKDAKPVEERGWQDAVQEIYPLKINDFRVVDGEITYIPGGKFRPLRMTRVNFQTGNIRNIHSRERTYPSDVHLDAVVFNTATLRVDGHADYLAEPYAGLKTHMALTQLPLSYLTAIIADYASVRGGTLSAAGDIEYAPSIKALDLHEVTIKGVEADYVLTPANEAATEELETAAVRTAQDVSNDPGIRIQARRIRLTQGNVGYVDKRGDPAYRVFLSDVDLTVQDFSNQRAKGIGTMDIAGKFLGSGPSVIHATFRPQTKSPDFDLSVQVENTDMRTMNDLLRANANIDVSAGSFSLYSDLTVRDNAVRGYVKPIFKDIDVYDRANDRTKSWGREIYEGIVGGVLELFENQRTGEFATKATVSGPLDNPETSNWQIIGRVFQNAFFKAIRPGLDKPKDEKSKS